MNAPCYTFCIIINIWVFPLVFVVEFQAPFNISSCPKDKQTYVHVSKSGKNNICSRLFSIYWTSGQVSSIHLHIVSQSRGVCVWTVSHNKRNSVIIMWGGIKLPGAAPVTMPKALKIWAIRHCVVPCLNTQLILILRHAQCQEHHHH